MPTTESIARTDTAEAAIEAPRPLTNSEQFHRACQHLYGWLFPTGPAWETLTDRQRARIGTALRIGASTINRTHFLTGAPS